MRRCGRGSNFSDRAYADDLSRLKWKPPSENSIDFKAELRFPPLPNDPSEPDFYAKPTILLNTWLGGQDHEFFDEMEVDDDEWEKCVISQASSASDTDALRRMKESGEQLDDRVIEVCWDTSRGRWRMMRIRDDKPNANHKSIMEKILVSIDDGVEIEAVSTNPTVGLHTQLTSHLSSSRTLKP